MLKTAFLTLSLLVLASPPPGRRGPAPQAPSGEVRGPGFTLRYPAPPFTRCTFTKEGRYTMEENGTDIPLDIGPERVRFDVYLPRPAFLPASTRWKETFGWIRIFPLSDPTVPDYRRSYPDLASSAAEIRAILKAGAFRPAYGRDAPDWNCVDCEQTLHAKPRIVRTPWCAGVQYLTTYVQEASEIDGGSLIYNFEGISHDARFYIAVQFPLHHPALPFLAPDIADAPEAKVRAYYLQAEKRLNSQPDASFYPPLEAIRRVISSLRPGP